MLRHGPIRRAPSVAKILKYVCEKQFEGKADEVKEFNIAVEALGRPATFEPSQDSIVRVEAHHLRKRLQEYYETVGKDHRVKIRLPETGYAPQFEYADKQALETDEPLAIESDRQEDAAPAPPVLSQDEARIGGHDQSLPGRVQSWLSRLRRRDRMLALGVATGLGAVVLLWSSLGRGPTRAVDLSLRTSAAGTATPAGDLAAERTVRLNCGSLEADWVDTAGNTWLSDRYFTGGTAIQKPGARIQRTFDQDLYRTAREGDFKYKIPLPPGVYELHLHFAEIVAGLEYSDTDGTAYRRFSVAWNEKPLLRDFDIVLHAGGGNTAEEQVFTGVSPAEDGYLHLDFSVFMHGALVSGIEIMPALPGGMHPVRIVANTRPCFGQKGEQWKPDRYFLGGRLVSRWGDVSGADNPGLFASERFGQFSYAIPVTEGKYTLRLMFAESNFGVTNFGTEKYEQGGPGYRLFDVYCNGTTLLKNFDIFREAGGSNLAVVKTFREITPNGIGKIVLSFVPVRDYPTIRAIEVLPESD